MSTSSEQSLPVYAEAAAALQRCGMTQSPAELHGFALGLRVAGVADAREVWRRELYSAFDPADVLAGECRTLLDRLFAGVFDASDDTLQLTLLLPQDITVDRARLAAVRDWSQGFLFGFGLAGGRVERLLSAQARELLHDFAEFTRLDVDDVDNSAENQSALIEIEEYLRVGAMLIRDELRSDREPDESK